MENFIVTLIVAAIAATPGILAFLNQRRKDTFTLAEANQQAAIALVQPLNERIESLERKEKELRGCITSLEKVVGEKEKRIKALEGEAEADRGRIGELEGTVAQRETTIHELEGQLSESNNALQNLAKMLDDRIQRIRNLETEIKTLRDKVARLEKKDTGPLVAGG